MKRILFVDDEHLVLDGLRRSLSSLRKQWQMEFCESPVEACGLLDAAAFDVVVSDMRMPGMDGSQLLEYVARRRPDALRVILSGQSEMDATVRAAVIAHQFIAKPCEGQAMKGMLERTIKLQKLLTDQELRALVSSIRGLPSPPRTYQVLSALVSNPEVDLDQVTDVVAGDLGLVAKLLQLVNSSFFGLARKVTSVREAVSMLGINRLKSVVLCSEVYRSLDAADAPRGFDPDAELAHSQATARIARSLLADKAQAEFAFLAAMLHDIGMWILASCKPSTVTERYRDVRQCGTSNDEADVLHTGLPHARLGAYLLGIWNLPYPVVEAVAAHHWPSSVGAKEFDALGAVHVAHCLASSLAAKDEASAARHLACLDLEYLRAAGVADRVDDWMRRARAAA